MLEVQNQRGEIQISDKMAVPELAVIVLFGIESAMLLIGTLWWRIKSFEHLMMYK